MYLGMYFEDVIEQLKSFLTQNPSEFVIVSIQDEYKEQYCDRSFSDTLKFYIDQYNSSFYVLNPASDAMPRIDQVQGKIVLFHKYFHVSSYNKKKFELVGVNSTIFIQDWCCKPGLVRKH
jgi:1-phosphatidylinositol phosphodiesterase